MIKDPNSLVRCQLRKSSKSLKWESRPYKDAPSYGAWAMHDSLFAKAMKRKSKAKAKEEQAMQSTSTTSKRRQQAPFYSNKLRKSSQGRDKTLTSSHIKTWKPSQGRDKIPTLSHIKTRESSQGCDKTPRGPFKDLEARRLAKSPRLQQHFHHVAPRPRHHS